MIQSGGVLLLVLAFMTGEAPTAEALAGLHSVAVDVGAGVAAGHGGRSGVAGDPHEVLAARSWAMVDEMLRAALAANGLAIAEHGSYPQLAFRIDAVQASTSVALCARLEIWDLATPRSAPEHVVPALTWRAEGQCRIVPSNFGDRESFALSVVRAQLGELQRALPRPTAPK